MPVFFLIVCFFWVLPAWGQDLLGFGPLPNRPGEGGAPKVEVQLLATAFFEAGRLRLHLDGRVPEGYHLYSVAPQGPFGPQPTKLELTEPDLISLGELRESEPELIEDQALDERLWVHRGDFWVERDYRLPTETPKQVRGFLLYQVCDNLICLNPVKQPFLAAIK